MGFAPVVRTDQQIKHGELRRDWEDAVHCPIGPKASERRAMNTRGLMQASALFMAIVGITTSFLPQEILAHAGSKPETLPVIALQMLGAFYLGFAILNWMARGNLIGGIYSRPVALGNFAHFAICASVLIKAAATAHWALEISVAAGLCAAFAGLFGWVLFTHPAQPRPAG
jgi:hypothetical protein